MKHQNLLWIGWCKTSVITKYYLKQHTDIINAIPDPGPVITAAFNDITSEDCLAWAKHCGYGQWEL